MGDLVAHVNKVIRSVNAPGGLVCVDIVQGPDGRFGFAQYRRDTEDGRGWYFAGLDHPPILESAAAALDAARARLPWLADDLD